MILSRHSTVNSAAGGTRWALGGKLLPASFSLSGLLELPRESVKPFLELLPTGETADAPRLAPLEPPHEVWASGVTYERSREARRAESGSDVYDLVYDAERPELFLKSMGWRVVGDGAPIRIRRDSAWNVPEPELVLVLNVYGDIVGYTAGNDVSSRDIEGANPLYLPQAKLYNGSCALGPSLVLTDADALKDLPIRLEVSRHNTLILDENIRTSRMHRRLEDLADYLFRELSFPHGTLLMTGTGLVPPDDFSLEPGDRVRVTVGEVGLENVVEG